VRPRWRLGRRGLQRTAAGVGVRLARCSRTAARGPVRSCIEKTKFHFWFVTDHKESRPHPLGAESPDVLVRSRESVFGDPECSYRPPRCKQWKNNKMVICIQGAPLADISLQQVLGTPWMAKAAAKFEALPVLALDEVCR